MLNIATVQVGNYRGRGRDYVTALFNGCRKHLTVPARFVCFTDDADTIPEGVEPRILPKGIDGWYNKLLLFHPSAFDAGERVLYFDLDTIIVRTIDKLAGYDGPFAALRDVYHPEEIGSGVMAWEAGRCDHIFAAWKDAGCPTHPRGDQGVIAEHVEAVRLQDIFPNMLVSQKVECWGGRIPPDASVVFFHGEPKPDNCPHAWVHEAWDIKEKA